MMSNQKIKIIYCLLFFTISSSSYGQKVSKDLPVYQDTRYSFRERAAELVSRMTLSEEVLQLHTNHAPAIIRLGVQEYYYWSECQHGVNSLFGNLNNGDKTHGNRRVNSTSFPTNFASTMSWDPKLVYQETTAISDEARGFIDKSLWGAGQNNLGSSREDYGFLTYWAPTINMDRDPRWGRTDEAFGEDPYLASKMAGAFVDGIQGQTMEGNPMTKYLKVAATAKHYALNSYEDDRTGSSSNADDELIRDYYTETFRNLIEKAHVVGLMTSYNAVNGTPAVANTYTINELAMCTYGFNGYITSDCGAVNTIYRQHPGGHFWAPQGWVINNPGDSVTWTNKQTGVTISAIAGGQAYAVRAGTALNCVGFEYTISNIREDIKAGILSKGVIDQALTRVFTIRMRTGEFDPPDKVYYTRITKSVIQNPAHQKLAEEVAVNSLVLLKDSPLSGEKERLLPLDASRLLKVVILGNLANKVTLGGYSSRPSLQVSAVEGITKAIKKNNPNSEVFFYDAGTSTKAKVPATLNDDAKVNIRSADLVVVFVGTDQAVAREGYDRKSLSIPGNYNSMISQVTALGNPRMVLVIQSDGPINIEDVQDKFPSIVFSGYNGESQGTALAEVLLGQKDPSGHLDFTWYKDDSQLPGILNYSLSPNKTNGLGRTYMYFTGEPTYPFGYGLSYSQFKCSHVSLSNRHAFPDGSIKISFDITNTGSVAGATVPQLYVTYPQVKDKELPGKKLEGFLKTESLQPKQTQHISLNVKLSNLMLWNEKELKEVVYNGSYQFQIGFNSHEIVTSKTVDIQGDLTPKIRYVTVQLPELIYQVGETLNLNGKNKWIKSDVDEDIAQPHAIADNIIEAARNDGSFVDLAHAKIKYHSSDNTVTSVSADGIIKAKAPGVATITVTVDGISGSTVLVVKRHSA